MGKKQDQPPQSVINQAQSAYTKSQSPTDTEKEMVPFSQGMMNNYNVAAGRAQQDYGDIMGAYKSFQNQNQKAPRPGEVGESYGYLREAMPGYRNFAETGGYSPTDIQDLRARGVSPIRAAYGNTMMQLDRSRALGGAGGSPNYIAAVSRAQRDQPQQLADAMQGVNAGLAESIRQGKEFGLQGITGTGTAMGGLAAEEANRELQNRGQQLSALSGQTSLYGTAPGAASVFGNQALSSLGQRTGAEQARNNYGLGLLDEQLRAYGTNQGQENTPWWRKALGGAAAGAATYFTGGAAAPFAGQIYGGIAG